MKFYEITVDSKRIKKNGVKFIIQCKSRSNLHMERQHKSNRHPGYNNNNNYTIIRRKRIVLKYNLNR